MEGAGGRTGNVKELKQMIIVVNRATSNFECTSQIQTKMSIYASSILKNIPQKSTNTAIFLLQRLSRVCKDSLIGDHICRSEVCFHERLLSHSH